MLGLERNGKLVLISGVLTGIAEGFWFFILPLYIAELGASPRQVGITLSLGSASAIVGFLIGGFLADRFDRKTLLLFSRGFSVVGMIILALADRWPQVIPGLSLFYLAWFARPVLTSYLAHIYRHDNPVRAFTAAYSGLSLGLVISPSFGGWIAANVSIKATFLVAAVFFLLAAVPYFFIAPQRRERAVLSIEYRKLFKNRELNLLLFSSMLILTALYLGRVLAPNYLQEQGGLDVAQIGRLGTAAAAGTVVFNIILGRTRVRTGLLFSQLGMVFAMVMILAVPEYPFVWIIYFLFGLYGTANYILTGMVAPLVSDTISGMIFGFQSMSLGFSIVLSSFIAGILYEYDKRLPFVTAAVLLVLLLSLTLRITTKSALNRTDPSQV